MKSCAALFITAPASGQGKTTVTAALARYYRQQEKKVHVFKTGPDFIDPMILEQASGNFALVFPLKSRGSGRTVFDMSRFTEPEIAFVYHRMWDRSVSQC